MSLIKRNIYYFYRNFSLVVLVISIFLLIYIWLLDARLTPEQAISEITSSSNSKANFKEPLSPQITRDPIDAKIADMSLENKISQLIFVAYDGQDSENQLKKMVSEYGVGGVMLMSVNTYKVSTSRQFISELQDLSANKVGEKLFISVDQEGGKVSRFKQPEFNLVSQRQIKSREQAQNVASKRAKELVDVGVNVNFSPVLEKIESKQSFLYPRVFSGGSEKIIDYGSIFINTYQANGLSATAKHYPGHDDKSIDSHGGLPVVNLNSTEFTQHIKPFDQTIRNSNPDFVMTGHILFPNQDPTYPASLSKKIIGDYLKSDLDYKKIIITDDLSMGAILDNYSLEEACVLALKAGNDMLLIVEDLDSVASVIAAIEAAITSGELKESQIDESLRKVLTKKLVLK